VRAPQVASPARTIRSSASLNQQHDLISFSRNEASDLGRPLFLDRSSNQNVLPLAQRAIQSDLPVPSSRRAALLSSCRTGAAVAARGRVVALHEALEYAFLRFRGACDPRVLYHETQAHRVVALAQTRHGEGDALRLCKS